MKSIEIEFTNSLQIVETRIYMYQKIFRVTKNDDITSQSTEHDSEFLIASLNNIRKNTEKVGKTYDRQLPNNNNKSKLFLMVHELI